MPRRLALAMVALATFDLWREEGLGVAEVLPDLGEKALIVAFMVAIALAMLRLDGLDGLDGLDAREATLRLRLDQALTQGAEWRAARAAEIAALGEAIAGEFRAWGLAPAEADVAGLLLKGAAMKEIAAARDTSEATIRQQAQAIYRKGGLAGWAELQAYFLDSLFAEAEDGRAALRAVT